MKKVGVFLLVVMLSCALFSCLTTGRAMSPLYRAVLDGNLAKVKKLVESGVDIDVGSYNSTPLEVAAARGDLDIVQYLLANGAQNPQKAYQSASRMQHTEVTKFLLDGGYVDINNNAISFYSILNDKKVPFETRMQTVKDMTGGKLNSPYLLALVESENYQKVIEFFGINLADKADALGNSVLHIAAMRNDDELIKYLLEHNFNVNALDNNGHTALFYSITCFGASIDWYSPVIENEKTAEIHFISDDPYYTNIQEIQRKQVAIATALLDAGINVNQQNKDGWTVLHFASAAYSAGLREFLVSRGADDTLKTNFGRTPADILAMRK
ncbi:MAG: ankyrin repeat domain-containing protein [Treponema sp.]|jgi:ankyrin repeat protein|nr:ankyrin repeat domain-containing protein [Treponema sp.]